MRCPKCGYKQSPTDSCVSCGIVFSKYYEIQKRKTEETKPVEEPVLVPAATIDDPPEAEGFISSLVRASRLPWNVVSTPALIAISSGFGITLYFLATIDFIDSGSSLVLFMVHEVNLVFHEAGHWIFGVFGNDILAILGGSLNQVLIPLVVTAAFWRQRDAAGFAFGAFWMFESLVDVAVYMADARALELPLLGGGGEEGHDWRNLFMRWGLLAKDTLIAGYVRKIGWFGMVLAWLWLIWRWFAGERKTP